MGTSASPSAADLGSDELGEQPAELAQLEEGGVGVIAEVALGEHPQTHQLFIMRLQVSEVRRRYRHPAIVACRCEGSQSIYAQVHLHLVPPQHCDERDRPARPHQRTPGVIQNADCRPT